MPTAMGYVCMTAKTKTISFHSTGYKYSSDNMRIPRIILNDLTINWKDTIKLFGVTLDCWLTWKPQTTATVKKCLTTLGRIRKFHAYLPNSCRHTLILMLTLSYFDYCASLFIDLSFDLSSILSHAYKYNCQSLLSIDW